MQKPVGTENDSTYHIIQKRSTFVRAADLFNKYKTERLKMSNIDCIKMKCSSRRRACVKIFTIVFQKIVEDLVENNIILRLPMFEDTPAEISMDRIEGDEFERRYLDGQFFDLDYLKTNFSAARPYVHYRTKSGKNLKHQIKLSRYWNQKITDNLNNGKIYY